MITALADIASIIAGLFPALRSLALVGAKPRQDLLVTSPSGRTILEGDASSPDAARRGDGVGVLYAQLGPNGVVALYWSATQAPSANWIPIATGASPPIAATPGTPIAITGGSEKVKCG